VFRNTLYDFGMGFKFFQDSAKGFILSSFRSFFTSTVSLTSKLPKHLVLTYLFSISCVLDSSPSLNRSFMDTKLLNQTL
jgi:hypothetical protein